MINEEEGRWFRPPSLPNLATLPSLPKLADGARRGLRRQPTAQDYLDELAGKRRRRIPLPAPVAKAVDWIAWHLFVQNEHVGLFGKILGGTTGVFLFLLVTISILAGALHPERVMAFGVSLPGVETVLDAAGIDTSSLTQDGEDDDKALAVATIPSDYMLLYRSAAASCNMPWQVLAGVGKIETNHGQSTAPGVHSGTNFAGAAGPMQFLPATFRSYAVDGNKDGTLDIYDPADAIYSAARYLCANGAADDRVRDALWNYNHDSAYVANVMAAADEYKSQAYALPLPAGAAGSEAYGRPHHDYPAIDVPVPVGTTVYAVHAGKVRLTSDSACGYGIIIEGTDGARYTYCHGSSLAVGSGDEVQAGDVIMRSGGAPGAAGAGDATGPHLHLSIDYKGQKICPQSLLQGWLDGKFVRPGDGARSGCST